MVIEFMINARAQLSLRARQIGRPRPTGAARNPR